MRRISFSGHLLGMSTDFATRIVVLDRPQGMCPFGGARHLASATHLIVTGEVRGVFCERHRHAAVKDHVKALRYLERQAARLPA